MHSDTLLCSQWETLYKNDSAVCRIQCEMKMQGVLLKKKRIAKYISKYGIFWYWVLYNFIRLETMKLVLTLSYRE